MENVNIVFKKVRDSFDNSYYYKFKGLRNYDNSTFDSLEEEQFYLAQIKETKKIILNDIRKIVDYRLPDLENKDALMENLQVLLDTYDNDVDGISTSYYERDITNFIMLTDSHLCFNNIENNVDDDDFFLAYGDVNIFESIVLIDRNFKTYHFINMTTNLLTNKTETTIESFQIKESEVISNQTKYRGRFILRNYSEDTPQKIRKRIASQQRKAS